MRAAAVPCDGRLHGDPRVLAALAVEGVATVANVVARAEVVRDLPDRANLVLRAGGVVLRIKRVKSRRPPKESAGLRAAAAAGVPVPIVAIEGLDPRFGSMVGTVDLAPARPMDDLIREGLLAGDSLRAVTGALALAVARLHDAGLHHRDLYLNHVYADPGAETPGVVLIDWDRLGTHRARLARRVVKDLAAIESSVPEGSLSCRQRARLLSDYVRARRLDSRRLLGPLLRRVLRKAARIRRHAPRTPVGEAGRPRS